MTVTAISSTTSSTSTVTTVSIDNSPNTDANYASPLFDISHLTGKDNLGVATDPDVVEYINNVISSGLSEAVINALMMYVLTIANKNKQQERLLALQEANMALDLARSAVQTQKDAAYHQFVSDMVGDSMGATSGAVGSLANGIGAFKAWRMNKAIDKAALEKFPIKNKELKTSATEPLKGSLSGEPPSYDEIAQMDEKSQLEAVTKKSLTETNANVSKAQEAGFSEDDVAADTAPQTTSKNQKFIDENKDARDAYIADAERVYHQKIERGIQIATSLATMFTSMGKMAAANGQLQAGNENAQATLLRSLAEYLNIKAQNSTEIAGDNGQIIQGAIDVIKSIEQARHSAAAQTWA